MSRLKLVKFGNGKYGVRVGWWPFYSFIDLVVYEPKLVHTCNEDKSVILYCQGTKEKAIEAIKNVQEEKEKLKYKVVKFKDEVEDEKTNNIPKPKPPIINIEPDERTDNGLGVISLICFVAVISIPICIIIKIWSN